MKTPIRSHQKNPTAGQRCKLAPTALTINRTCT
jgi:hypothetical protein